MPKQASKLLSPPEEPQRRLYLGLLPPAIVQAQVLAHMQDWYWQPESRRTHAPRLHLTLHFLGEVGFAHEQWLRAQLPTVRFAAFDLHFNDAQAWRNGIAVLLPQESRALSALYAQLGKVLQQAGLPAHKPYTPHLTLARHAAQARPPDVLQPVHWPVDALYLVWSQLPPRWPQARYEILECVAASGTG
jgi:RNA 2',3'-cyclic 3'-phosphodiesterase